MLRNTESRYSGHVCSWLLREPVFESWEPFRCQLVDFMEAMEKDRAPVVDGDSCKLAVELIHELYYGKGEQTRIDTQISAYRREEY